MGSKPYLSFRTQFSNSRQHIYCCSGILGTYQVGAAHITCLELSHPECSLTLTSKQVKAITQLAPGHPGYASEIPQTGLTCLPPILGFFFVDFPQEASILPSLWPAGWSQPRHIRWPRKSSQLECFHLLSVLEFSAERF